MFRADSIVRDLEHVRTTVYQEKKWALIAQSFGGWITLTYLSFAPGGLTACYIHGGVPGTPPSAAEVYRRTFRRVQEIGRASCREGGGRQVAAGGVCRREAESEAD